MERFTYPATLTPDEEDGGYVVTFADVPEAITQGESLEDSLDAGAGALEAAIAGSILDARDIPAPSAPARGQHRVAVPALMAAKAALYLAVREAGINQSELARRLDCDEKEVRRMLDPRHATRINRLESALAALGRRLVVDVRAA